MHYDEFGAPINDEIDKKIAILENKYPIMERIALVRVFFISSFKNKIDITENCDQYFSITITPRECESIGKFFIELSKEYKKEYKREQGNE